MIIKLLENAPLFRGLGEDEIREILSRIPYNIKNYRSGSMIAQSGEKVNQLFVVAEGLVKGEMVDSTGKVIKIENIPAKMALAPAFMFGDRNFFPVNVVAVSDVKIFSVDKVHFLKLLMSDSRLLVNFLDMISSRSQFLSEKIRFLSFRTIKRKLAHLILEKAGRDRIYLNLGMTQGELSDFFGVARPSIARALGEMESDGLIEAKGKEIKIIDRPGLSALITD